jgi:pimeloyl-ACP methyl ester carboxylesterase
MRDALCVVLIPGLNCSARLYGEQIPALWRFGPVQVADHTRDDAVAAIAARILAAAPPQFALLGLSMGGYIAFEIMRRAPERVARLALLDTSARPDTPEQTARRRLQIELARTGRFDEIPDQMFPLLVARGRRRDAKLAERNRAMAADTGPEAFVRQQTAIICRPDSRPDLSGIRVPTLVVVGEDDELTPLPLAQEIAAGISGARLKIVADCGHLSTLEQPEIVTAAIVEWMAG